MKRREFVSTIGLTAMGIMAGQAVASAAENTAAPAKKKPVPKEIKNIVDAAGDCLKTGNICLAHCQVQLEAGDTSLAECQRMVMNMLAVCDGMAKLAAYNSCGEIELKQYAKNCATFCRSCEDACEKHVSHHAECKACHDSCKNCATACETFAA